MGSYCKEVFKYDVLSRSHTSSPDKPTIKRINKTKVGPHPVNTPTGMNKYLETKHKLVTRISKNTSLKLIRSLTAELKVSSNEGFYLIRSLSLLCKFCIWLQKQKDPQNTMRIYTSIWNPSTYQFSYFRQHLTNPFLHKYK